MKPSASPNRFPPEGELGPTGAGPAFSGGEGAGATLSARRADEPERGRPGEEDGELFGCEVVRLLGSGAAVVESGASVEAGLGEGGAGSDDIPGRARLGGGTGLIESIVLRPREDGTRSSRKRGDEVDRMGDAKLGLRQGLVQLGFGGFRRSFGAGGLMFSRGSASAPQTPHGQAPRPARPDPGLSLQPAGGTPGRLAVETLAPT